MTILKFLPYECPGLCSYRLWHPKGKSKVAKNEEKKLHNIQFFSRSIMCTKKIMENTPAKQVTVMEHKLKKWNCMKVPCPFAHPYAETPISIQQKFIISIFFCFLFP